MDNMSFGIALGMKKRAEGAERGVARLSDSLDSAMEQLINYAQQLRDARIRIRELELELLVTNADVAGKTAMIKGFREQHPDSPMQADTGMLFKDGDKKNVGQVRYAKVFDAFLRSNGIADPVQYRAD